MTFLLYALAALGSYRFIRRTVIIIRTMMNDWGNGYNSYLTRRGGYGGLNGH